MPHIYPRLVISTNRIIRSLSSYLKGNPTSHPETPKSHLKTKASNP
jgi:hypothetical protein